MNQAAQYRHEIDAAVASCDAALAASCVSLLQQTPLRRRRTMSQKQFIRVCFVILLLLVLLSVAAFAALRLLTAHEVAQTLENDAVAALFAEQDKTVSQSVADGDYTITLLGTANGAQLAGVAEEPFEESHSYAVLAVERKDGMPVSPEEGASFLFLPLIGGYEPARIAPFTMTIGRCALYQDGVMYTIVDMIDLTPFSDRALWLCLLQSPFPTADVLGMDENGDPVYQDSYTGVRALFRLPADPADADAQRAAELLQQAGLE